MGKLVVPSMTEIADWGTRLVGLLDELALADTWAALPPHVRRRYELLPGGIGLVRFTARYVEEVGDFFGRRWDEHVAVVRQRIVAERPVRGEWLSRLKSPDNGGHAGAAVVPLREARVPSSDATG
jgi:hypothetical protein